MKPQLRVLKEQHVASRWARWASRLTSRFARQVDTFRMSLMLHASVNRMFWMVGKRWLLSTVFWRQYLQLALSGSPVAFFSPIRAQQISFFTGPFSGPAVRVREQRAQITAFTGAVNAAPARILSAPVTASFITTKRSRIYAWEDSVAELVRGFRIARAERVEFQATDVKRLVHRSERQEDTTVLRAAMTLRREGTVITAAAVPAAQTLSAEQHRPTTASGSPINVDLLTEHVIRQIDRRVIARKERMGRI
jgi:hypothetical protein